MNKIESIFIVCSALLILGTFDLPIGYYTFLRIFVSLTSIIAIVRASAVGSVLWQITFILVGILFNPIIPVYFNDKEAWVLIDIFVAALFFIIYFSFDQKLKNE